MSKLERESQFEQIHVPYMRRCIELAKMAFDNGNTPVGSIIVLANEIIAEGMETLPSGMDVTGHAELIAVQNATNRLNSKSLMDSTLYSTAEPCFMCSYAIRNAKIARVVYCLDTPLIGGVTSAHPILTDKSLDGWRPAPEIISGILAADFAETKSGWNND